MNEYLPIVLFALTVGLLPLVAMALRRPSRTSGGAVLGIVVASFAAVVAGAVTNQSRLVEREAAMSRLPDVLYENDYVGSGACRSCHPSEHATWHASYHRSMTQVAGPESVEAPFEGTELLLEGITWHTERRGDEFWVRGKDAESEVEWRVAMTTGSHNYQLYWLDSQQNDGLAQFPLVYLLHDQMWIPRKWRFLQPPLEHTPIETGRWKAHCIKCHATGGKKAHEPGGETCVVELGISCEACHGPGGRHVAANQSPLRRYEYHLGDQPDPTIVNPGRLPHERSTEVCGQCHGIEIFLDDKTAETWAREGTRFRPGDELRRFQTMVTGRYEDNPPEVQEYLDDHETFRLAFCFWEDGTLRVTGREYHGMLESPCYQRGEMSCLSCHTMHKRDDDERTLQAWANDQLGPRMDGDAACLACHPKFEETASLVAHTHHEAGSTGSACYNCHMPYTTWGLLGAIRSHTVESPSVQTSLATGRPNACNQCHLDRTLAWSAEKLQAWYGMELPELSEEEMTTAASAIWAVSGDAGQRALMAWSMGWAPAREVSGSDWMVPLLTMLMMDPYHAVRYNAQRSLRRYPDFAEITANSNIAPTEEEQQRMAAVVFQRWKQSYQSSSAERDAQLLIDPDGSLSKDRFRRLAEKRDNSVLVLFE